MFSVSQTKRRMTAIFAAVLMAAVSAASVTATAADKDVQQDTTEVYQYVSKCNTWLRKTKNNISTNKIVKISKGRYVQVFDDDGDGWAYALCMAEDDNIYGGWISLYQFQSAGFAPPDANLAPAYDSLRVIGKLTDTSEEELEPPPMPTDVKTTGSSGKVKTTEAQPETPPMPKETVLETPPMPKQTVIETHLPTPPMPKDEISSQTAVSASTVGAPSDVQKSETKKKIWNYLTGTLGFNRAAACAIMVNIREESGFNPTREVIDTNDEISIGLFQWNGERCEAFKAYCDARTWEYGSLDSQLAYLKYELNNSRYWQYQKMLSFENSASGCYDASYYWASTFEVCSKSQWEPRAKAAETYYNS